MDPRLEELLARIGGVRTLVAIALSVFALFVLKRLFSRAKGGGHLTTTRCPSCGWTGSVSRYKPVCPSCAKTLQP